MSSQANPMDLLKSVQAQGGLSGASMTVAKAVLNNADLGQMIMEATSTPPDLIKKVQQTLLTVVVDDSGSIRQSGNEQAMRDAVNFYIKSQLGGRYSEGIMISIIYLNGTVLDPYKPINEATELNDSNYLATGQTPLYDVACSTLLSVIAKAEEIESQTGAQVRTLTIFFTDGQDYGSVVCKASDTNKIATDMFSNEGKHIIAGFGIGTHYDWNTIFGEMGIPHQWIWKVGDSAKELRAGAGNASRTTANVINQQNGSFSQQAIQGGAGFAQP